MSASVKSPIDERLRPGRIQNRCDRMPPRRRLITGGRFTLALILLASVSAMTGCAGYQLGNATLYRTDLKTIHVPMFQSNSLRRDVGEWLTEAVVKEIELRTPYKVVHEPLADSILTGRVMWDDKTVLSENINDEPRSLKYAPSVQVMWIDNSGQILLKNSIHLDAFFVPEAGQSITSAEMKSIRRIASQIVSQMEARNW